tara:strand:+ start:77 stop:526 length:450 start_codon:yes stop_codon:yes gene_type:complete
MRSILFILIGVISFEGFAIPKQLICEEIQTQSRLDKLKKGLRSDLMYLLDSQPPVGTTFMINKFTFDSDNLKTPKFEVIHEREILIPGYEQNESSSVWWSVSPQFIMFKFSNGTVLNKLDRKTLLFTPYKESRSKPCKLIDVDTSSNQL